MAYLLDANVFMEAANRYYATDICPGFWAWMEQAVSDGTIVSTQRVRDDGRKKVKIPEPRSAHGVEYINTFTLLRRLGARFKL